MARSLDARLARLEGPPVDAGRAYRMLKACYEVLTRIHGEPMPSDAELMAMARADTRPNFTRSIEAVWKAQP